MDLIETGDIFSYKPANISRLDISGTTKVSRFELLFLASPRAKVRQTCSSLTIQKVFHSTILLWKLTYESYRTVFCRFRCKMFCNNLIENENVMSPTFKETNEDVVLIAQVKPSKGFLFDWSFFFASCYAKFDKICMI